MRSVNQGRVRSLRLTLVLGLAVGLVLSFSEASTAATWLTRLVGVDSSEVVANSDGSLFVFGVGSSFNVLAKFDADGNVLWAKKILMPDGVYAEGGPLAASNDGGAIVMNRWNDGGGNRRQVIARFDKDGSLLGQAEVTPVYTRIMVDGGSLYLGGAAADEASVGQILLAKVDLATMSLVWSKAFRGMPGVEPATPQMFFKRLNRDLDGGILVACRLVSAGVFGVAEGLLFKVDPAGSAVFSKRLTNPGNANQYTTDIVPVGDGYAFIGITLERAGEYDLWIGKLSTAWDFRWQKALSGCGYVVSGQLVKMRNGSLSISAQSNSWSNSGDPDALVVNVRSTDAWVLNWQKRYWTLDPEHPHGIAETSDGGIALSVQLKTPDYVFGNGSFGGGESFSAGLLVKTDASGGVAANGCGNIPCPAVANGSLGVTDTTATVSDYALATASFPATLSACEYKLEAAYVSSNRLCGK